ncbi:MAG: uroporphyrinogen decarboxylase family protein [Chloroflexi bacterium]|nr:uroporphyrinogen decarboxylase family protein [Chloroflexota bacterium]
MMTPWERFATVARGGQADRVPVALIVDSPWLPGYADIDTLDYFLREDEWLRINLALLDRFPEVAWIPGFWIEYGMAAEPSAFGARVQWNHDSPPSIEAAPGGLAALVNLDPPNPQEHGLMPLVLQRYADAEKRLGLEIKMVAARGPMAIGSWVVGAADFLLGLMTEPEASHRFMDILTTTIIAWLKAQLAALRAPEGIMLLDDIVGMVSPQTFEEFVRPYYTRIFAAFPGLIKVYHNDTPCPKLVEPIATLGFDVFNFSHTMDIATVQARMPNIALMGNVPPLDLMVRGTPEQVEQWARECIQKTGGRGLILSAGGGASPGTRAECIDALVAARTGAIEIAATRTQSRPPPTRI